MAIKAFTEFKTKKKNTENIYKKIKRKQQRIQNEEISEVDISKVFHFAYICIYISTS